MSSSVVETEQNPSTTGEAGDRRQTSPQRRERQLFAMVTWIALAVLGFAARLRYATGSFSGDEPHYLVFNVALQKYHSLLNVLPVYQNGDYAPFYGGDLDPHTVMGPNGELPWHSFGGPLLWHIPYLIWGTGGAMAFIVLVSALVVGNIFLLLRELGIERLYATLVALVFAVGSPLFVYSSMAFVEPIAALVVIFGVRVVLAPRLVGWRVGLAAIGIGALPWVHGRFVLLAVSVAVLLVWRVYQSVVREHARWDWRGALPLGLWLAVPLVVLVGGLLVFNGIVWHSLNPAPGNAAHGDRIFDVPVYRGLGGLLLDRSYGLIPSFPIFATVVPGILLTLRRQFLTVNIALATVIAPYLLIISTFNQWWAGYSATARFLTAVVPLLAYHLAVFLQRMHHWLPVAATVLASLASFAVGLTANVIPEYKWHPVPQVNDAMGELSHLLGIERDWQASVPSAFDPIDHRLFVWWVVGLAAAGVALWLVARRAPAHRTPVPEVLALRDTGG